MALETTPFDPAAYLDDDEAIAGYLSDALETNDPVFIADALGVVARAKGMALIAEETGLSRESLYRALSSKGNPEFSTVLRVTSALGIQLRASTVVSGKNDTGTKGGRKTVSPKSAKGTAVRAPR